MTGLVTFSPRTPRCLPLTTMANPPAAILGADELLALEDGGLGAVITGELAKIGLDGTATHDQADARADFIGGPRKA